jgi:hypothetical protein
MMPPLTTAGLVRYIGGQAEVQHPTEGYLYRGEIENVFIQDDDLKIKFSWVAKGEGYPPLPTRWINSERLDYAVNARLCYVVEHGENRIVLQARVVGEIIVLFGPSASRLEPEKVEGLDLAEKVMAKRPFHESVIPSLRNLCQHSFPGPGVTALFVLIDLIKCTKVPEPHIAVFREQVKGCAALLPANAPDMVTREFRRIIEDI